MDSTRSAHRNRWLAAIAHKDYAALHPALETVDLVVNTILIDAQQPSRYVYFPLAGIVSVIANASRSSVEIGMIGREGIAGLSAAFGSKRTPHTYLVQATGSASRISTDDLQSIVASRPEIFRWLGLYAMALLAQTGQTAYANASFTLEKRLARWILMTQDRTDGEDQLLTHEFLSTMLGVERTSVTVTIHVLEGMGTIRARRGRITVLDRDKLLALAEDSYRIAEDEYERLLATI